MTYENALFCLRVIAAAMTNYLLIDKTYTDVYVKHVGITMHFACTIALYEAMIYFNLIVIATLKRRFFDDKCVRDTACPMHFWKWCTAFFWLALVMNFFAIPLYHLFWPA